MNPNWPEWLLQLYNWILMFLDADGVPMWQAGIIAASAVGGLFIAWLAAIGR